MYGSGEIMKVLYVCSKSLKTAQTGAATQARETFHALVRHGCEVTRIYAQIPPGIFEEEDGSVLDEVQVQRLIESHDVTHLIYCSRPVAAYWRRFRPHRPTVGSTVFWSGWERVRIAHQNMKPGFGRLHSELSSIRQMFPFANDFRGIDIFLPNSQAEVEKIKSSYRASRGSFCVPVPNGFCAPSFSVSELSRSPLAPKGAYIVVPAVFAPRKNQLGLIQALADVDIQIVFMGAPLVSSEARWIYEKCKIRANARMHFIGYVSSESTEYWRLLAHAQCACLSSDCETPGIAMIEAAYAGARPVITRFGGTMEYFGFDAEYFTPYDGRQIREAVVRALSRGRLSESRATSYLQYSWDYCAMQTIEAYRLALGGTCVC